MYKTVRQGDASLQYRIIHQDESLVRVARIKQRLRRKKIACILIIALIIGCMSVAAAVIIPILLTTNIIALPAKFQTYSLSTKHGRVNLEDAQYIAILPVKDGAHLREVKLLHEENQNHSDRARAILLSSKHDWKSVPAWKAIGLGRLALVASVSVAVFIFLLVLLRRKARSQSQDEINWDLQETGLLSETEDD